VNTPLYSTPVVYTPQPPAGAFVGAFPAHPLHSAPPLPVPVADGTPMTVTTVMLADGRSVLGYVPAAPALPETSPAYRPGSDPVVMRSLSGGALLAGGGVGAWGLGAFAEGLGSAAEAIGRMASGAGGVVIILALGLGLARSLGGSLPRPGTGGTDAAGAAGGDTNVTKTVVTGPQQVVQARVALVRIKEMTANHSVDL
jgi:hypothetical protein